MDYSLLRVGNSVKYIGRLNDYQNQIGRITAIREDNSFSLAIKKIWPLGDPESIIAAYSKDLMPVFLDVDKFISLGFEVDEQRNVITKGNVNIINMAYLKPDKDMFDRDIFTLDIKGFRLVINEVSPERNEEEVMKNTIDVNRLHSLQNYYSLNLHEELYLA